MDKEKAISFDGVIKHIGWGRHQQLWVLYSILLGIITSIHILSSIFIAYPIPYVCESPMEEYVAKNCNQTIWNTSATFEQFKLETNSLDHCHMFNATVNSGSMNCTNWDILTIEKCTTHRFISDGSVSTSIVMNFNITCDRSWINYMLQSMFMVGVFFNGMIFGKLADMFGRRTILLLMGCSTMLLSFLTAAVRNLILYTIMRSVMGVFCLTLSISYVLTSECVLPRYRAFSVQMGSMGFSVGTAIFAVIAYFIRDWVSLQIAISVLSLINLIIWWLFDESPRWLISKGRYDEALKILFKIAKVNKANDEAMCVLNRYEASLVEMPAENLKHSGNVTEKFGMWHTLKYSGLRLQTIVLSYAWFVTSCVFYGMTLNVARIGGNIYFNTMIMGGMGIPSAFIATILCNKIGRCVVIYTSFLLCGIFCIAMYFIPDELKGLSLTVFLFGRVFSLVPFCTLFLYTIELYPTLMRATASNYGSALARIGAIVAPAISGLYIVHPSLPYVTFGVLSLLAGILMMLLPESRKARMFESMEEANEFANLNAGPLRRICMTKHLK
nr:organic cation transporter protein-like [Ciona intestinalis]|eukprot:XP_002119660.1 organic cation transporter protein-like [Ciona intestinalis]